MSSNIDNDRSTTQDGRSGASADSKPNMGSDTQASLKRAAREVGAEAQPVLDDAKAVAGEQAERARAYAAGSLDETASALHKAADEISDGSVRQTLLREAADGLGQIARTMEHKSMAEMARELSDYGRRHPAAFLGGAALFGLAVARFVRASGPDKAAGSRYRGEATEFASNTGGRGAAFDRDGYRTPTED